MHNLVEGIVASFEARTAGIASLQGAVREQCRATQAQLGVLGRNHQSMARHLRGELAQGRSELRAMVNAQLHGGHTALTKGEARRKGEVNTWLKEVDRNHQAMARHLQADLARGRAALTREVNTSLKEVDRNHHAMATGLRHSLVMGRDQLFQAEAQRQAAVQALMKHVAAERSAGRQEWQRLVAPMGSKRNGGAAVAEAPASPAPARGVPAEEEGAMARTAVSPVTPELVALSHRVFQYLANHPDGTHLTEIQREFGLGRLQAARVVRHLTDEGKVEKQDRCYYAT